MSDLEDKARETKRILHEWTEKHGHDRCFWHPDLLLRLAKLYDVDLTESTTKIPLDTFMRGCKLYQAQEYGLPIPPECEGIQL